MSSTLPEHSTHSIKSEENSPSPAHSGQLCELMTDSFVHDKSTSSSCQLPQESKISDKVPSIIKNLQQAEYTPQTRISHLILFHNNELYQEQMKTIRTLGIIPQQKSEHLISSKYCGKKNLGDDDDRSTKVGTPEVSRAVDRGEQNGASNFPTHHQSLIGENTIVFKLKGSCEAEKAFSLFRNYLLKSKLEVVNDSFNMIMAKLKVKGINLSTFIDSLKSIDGESNNINLCLSFMTTPRLLKLSLSAHPKHASKLHKYIPDLMTHSASFKQYLWENNCIDVSESESIHLTLTKERESVVEIKRLIKNMMKVNKNEIGLETCLLKALELRELLMYQIEEKGVQFVKCNPLLEIEKLLIEELDLYSVYKEIYAKDQEHFEQRKRHIKGKYSSPEIYSYLKIPESDRLIDEDGDFAYQLALDELNKFLSDPYPHLFLQNIESFYNSFELCKQNTNGRTSISREFQDQSNLELVILCLLESQQRGSYHKIKFIEHYLRLVDNNKYQKMCLNLAMGVDYIENSWKIES